MITAQYAYSAEEKKRVNVKKEKLFRNKFKELQLYACAM